MRILRQPNALPAQPRPVCLAIGFFDGVHLGHQQVILQAVKDAAQVEGQAMVVTFDRHPNTVVAPPRVPLLIYPLSLKLRALESLGPHAALVLPFDESLSRIPGDEFIRRLHRSLGPIHSVCVGRDFKFGYRRSGHIGLLQKLGAELGFLVNGLDAVTFEGEIVSSTRIRERIHEGRLDEAGALLGRRYAICGPVVPGDGLGRQIGFPTANIDVQGLVLPPPGVYAVHARLGEASHPAVLNIGWRPTVTPAQSPLRVEAHLLHFNGDLYGKDLETILVSRLRAERRFATLDELSRQIRADAAEAGRILAPPLV